MSITATVADGKIVLPPGVVWPDGTVVRIEQVEHESRTVRDLLKDFEGAAEALPADMAANHDHYIHGHAKR